MSFGLFGISLLASLQMVSLQGLESGQLSEALVVNADLAGSPSTDKVIKLPESLRDFQRQIIQYGNAEDLGGIKVTNPYFPRNDAMKVHVSTEEDFRSLCYQFIAGDLPEGIATHLSELYASQQINLTPSDAASCDIVASKAMKQSDYVFVTVELPSEEQPSAENGYVKKTRKSIVRAVGKMVGDIKVLENKDVTVSANAENTGKFVSALVGGMKVETQGDILANTLFTIADAATKFAVGEQIAHSLQLTDFIAVSGKYDPTTQDKGVGLNLNAGERVALILETDIKQSAVSNKIGLDLNLTSKTKLTMWNRFGEEVLADGIRGLQIEQGYVVLIDMKAIGAITEYQDGLGILIGNQFFLIEGEKKNLSLGLTYENLPSDNKIETKIHYHF